MKEVTYAEKQLIANGDTSPFNLFIGSEVVKQQAKTYDLGLEWQDQQGNEFTWMYLVINHLFSLAEISELQGIRKASKESWYARY
ncbi:MAG: hypothetical protein WBL68_08890 [Nitrososphaeraceae archaeon]